MTESRARKLAALLAAWLAGSAALHAETVITNEGKAYTGEVTVTPHVVKCVKPGITRTFGLPVVREIQLSSEERAQFEIRRREAAPLDAEGHYRLGMWLKSKHQHGTAQEFFRKVLVIDANHAGARQELGQRRNDGKWEYSPALHHRVMYDWVGRESLGFHLELALKLRKPGLETPMEKELRRVLQVENINATAIALIRPIVARYKLKNRYKLPFTGTWRAVSGPNRTGHGRYAYMMNAWDFRKVDEHGRFWSGPANDLKNHLTFEQPVYACADGEVYEVRDHFPDNPLGVVRPLKEGNRVLIRHANGERSVIGHLQKGSVKVKAGDKVTQGQFIGRIGNSGRSATPHIHFAIFDADRISLPMTFVDYRVREGVEFKRVESGQIEFGRIYDNRFETEEARMRRQPRVP